jgi:hypothetical protein
MLEGLQMKPELYYPIHKPPAEFYIVLPEEDWYEEEVGWWSPDTGGVIFVYTDAELTHVPTQECPTSKSAQIQHRQWFKRNQTGSVTSQQLGQFGIGANTCNAGSARA